ncbi:MAG: methyltransferase domain-containing protein [Micavibrio sp.]
MSDDILIFDRQRVRANRDRAACHAGEHAFLHDWAARAITGRLDDIKREFPLALIIGAQGSAPFQHHEKIGAAITMDLSARSLQNGSGIRLQGDEERLPFAPESFNLVAAPLTLHHVNDLPGALLQIRQCLKPDGLFLAAMLGGETLHELRSVMMEAEANMRGGISPRIAPFADKPQAGALLQRAGFNLPVIDSEIVTVTYDNAFKLMRDLRLMGEGNAILHRDKTFPGDALFMETARLYQDRFSEPDGRIRATFEIIFMIGWAPHDSQQKPLRPGTAQHRLADALGANEIGAGEKANLP